MKSTEMIDNRLRIAYHNISGLEDEQHDTLLTIQEVCELLKVSKGYIYWLTHQRKIPFIKMQGHLRFRWSDIDNWLIEQEVRSGDTQEKK